MKKLLFTLFMLLSFIEIMAQQITHTIQRGETIESIAKKYNVSVDALKKANPNISELFFVGLKLNIPSTQPIAETFNGNNVEIPKAVESTQERNNDVQSQQLLDNSSFVSNNALPSLNQPQEGGMEWAYEAIENGWGIGMNWVVSYFTFGGDLLLGKRGDFLKTNDGYELYIGGNYRYHITDFLYLEGRIIAGYYHWKTEYKDKGYKELNNSADEAFFGISPRAGLKYKKVAISAGYRWDWIKMKFKKENCLDRFTIGLTFIF